MRLSAAGRWLERLGQDVAGNGRLRGLFSRWNGGVPLMGNTGASEGCRLHRTMEPGLSELESPAGHQGGWEQLQDAPAPSAGMFISGEAAPPGAARAKALRRVPR